MNIYIHPSEQNTIIRSLMYYKVIVFSAKGGEAKLAFMAKCSGVLFDGFKTTNQ